MCAYCWSVPTHETMGLRTCAEHVHNARVLVALLRMIAAPLGLWRRVRDKITAS